MSESLRPRYHFAPRRNWMNDPNGLIWFEGEYHLFYQYNPCGDVWGHMSWGHAVSADLIHWTELPVAIPEDDDYMIFSGCVVLDAANTAGFAGPGQTALVAVYTGCAQAPRQRQNQQLAYSLDRGRSWTKYPGNPVLDIDAIHFRDPKVFWHRHTQRWIMIAVKSDLRVASFYASPDLLQWTHLSDFGPTHAGDGIWECPDLIALSAPDGQGDADGLVWMLKIDIFENHVAGSSGARVWFGQFDGSTFQPGPWPAQWADWGMDFYACASWANLPSDPPAGLAAEAIWLGWLDNHVYARELPTAPWRGQMSIPRTLALRQSGTQLELLQQPVRTLALLRRPLLALSLATYPEGRHAVTLPPDADLRALDIELVLRPGQTGSVGLALRVGIDAVTGSVQQTLIGFDAVRQVLFIDRSASGFLPEFAPYARRREAPWTLPPGGVLRLRILLDSGSVEVLTDDGSRWLSERIMPDAGSTGLALWSSGAALLLEQLMVFALDP